MINTQPKYNLSNFSHLHAYFTQYTLHTSTPHNTPSTSRPHNTPHRHIVRHKWFNRVNNFVLGASLIQMIVTLIIRTHYTNKQDDKITLSFASGPFFLLSDVAFTIWFCVEIALKVFTFPRFSWVHVKSNAVKLLSLGCVVCEGKKRLDAKTQVPSCLRQLRQLCVCLRDPTHFKNCCSVYFTCTHSAFFTDLHLWNKLCEVTI